MEVVILCGGKGTRLLPLTENTPKPLLYIGDRPILWHVMKLYAAKGHKDFVLLLGYKGDMIKDYFSNPGNIEKEWKITFVDTGIDTKKGDRIRMAKEKITGGNFILAYADDLSDVDINKVIDMHVNNKKVVTITAVKMKSIFGIIDIAGNGEVKGFIEKPELDVWISGGYIVLSRKIFEYLQPGKDETDAFGALAKLGMVQAYKHHGFWKTMNTIQDANELNEMWEKGELKKVLYPE